MRKSRLRLLPITMLVAFLALGIKVGEVMHDGHSLVVSFGSAAQAAPDAAPTKPAEGTKPDTTTDKKPEDPKKDDSKKSEGEGDNSSSDTGDNKNRREFSQVEVDLLQSLAQRRQELDNWSKQVQLKENMLIATEQRINEKIDNLQKMKKEIEDLLALYNEQEDTKIRSLVKIYENMKPKDAARIFEELDMPVLLIVVDRMSERKVSPILANMSPTRAKDLTIQLAEQRKLQKPRASAAAAAAEPPPATPGVPPTGSSAAAGLPAGADSAPAQQANPQAAAPVQ